jgi:hypothetical protein
MKFLSHLFKRFSLLALLTAGSIGCGTGNQDGAVRRAIEEHLSRRSDLAMDKMVLEVQQISVDGDRAQAEVVFRTTMDPPARMTYTYELRRDGGSWQVESGRPTGMETPHPEMGNPEGGELQSGELPQGHPPLTGGHPPLPEEHPQMDDSDPHQAIPPSPH